LIAVTVVRLPLSQPLAAEYQSCDQWGRPMFHFSIEYRHLGKQWTASIWAYDEDDAEARFAAIRTGGAVAGQDIEAGDW
jgi:hypothetical protein